MLNANISKEEYCHFTIFMKKPCYYSNNSKRRTHFPPEVANMGIHRSPVRFQQNTQKPPVQLQGKKKPTAS